MPEPRSMSWSAAPAAATSALKSAGKSAIRSRWLGTAVVASTRSKFRIVSYHGVPDADVFAKHVEYYASRWTPVSGNDVLASLTSGAALPSDAVWITFDDGESSVVAHALEPLTTHGVPATMYVCPGLVEHGLPYWWRVIDEGLRLGLLPEALSSQSDPVTSLKSVDDHTRRELVDATWGLLDGDIRRSLSTEVASIDELTRWHSNGLELGNHSWDHPLLNELDAEAQRDQVVKADDWMQRNGFPTRNFAYPNGNHIGAEGTAQALDDLGYELVVHHDHRLTARDSNPTALSRLKVESVDPVDRLASVVAGTQPLLRSIVDSVAAWR